ncbi:uncharacterized protein LOC116179476 [Photinus pyralis]|uniref:uncharacterized protein LOC116179476 n=1 Tax=Photinus pyralis TaxID=7054 RepID=UPI00126772A7|nr:uncharacterized protein LOC116179476 [Photinus pyralis]
MLSKENNAALIRRNLRDQSDPMSMPETQFRSLYRLSREMVHNLILELSPHLQDAEREELFIPKKLKIMVALHFFAHGSYQKAVGQDFCTSMSQSSVSKCLTVVVNALENLYHYVRFPQTQEEVTLVKQGPPVAAKIVNSCAVLHNMCILHGDQALIDGNAEC